MTALDTPSRATDADPSVGQGRSTWSAVATLARLEARRMSSHPLLWIGVALGALVLLPAVWPHRLLLPRESVMVQVAALPVATAALVVAHLATTRVRRDGVEELVRPARHGEDARTLALLVATLAPAAVTALLVGLALVGAVALGAVGPVWWAEAATAPALVAAGGAVGVLLGRLAPWRLAPLFAVVVLAVVQVVLSDLVGGPGQTSRVELLGPAVVPGASPPDPAALLRPAGLHLLYVLAAGGVAAALAALRSHPTPRRTGVAALAVVFAGAAGSAQLGPPGDERVEAVLARTSTPVAAGTCTTDPTNATVCALPLAAGWQPEWAALVGAVRDPLARRGLDLVPLTVAQRADPSLVRFEATRWYDPEDGVVGEHIDAAWEAEYGVSDTLVLLTSAWPRATTTGDAGRLDLALHVARRTVGLPVGFDYVHPDDTGHTEGTTACNAGGQAREAVAIWLATQADPAAEVALRGAVARQPYPGTAADPVDDGSAFADATLTLTLSTSGVVGVVPEWSKPGAHVALQMLERPAPEVLDLLAAEWSHWTDATTPLRDLVARLDLTTPPLAADLQEQLGGGSVDRGLEPFFRDTPLPAPVLDGTGTAALDVDPITAGGPIGCP